jgi:hypothetical protein
MTSALVLLGALAAAAFGHGAFFSTTQWLVAGLIIASFALALSAHPPALAELRGGVIVVGLSVAIWAVLRAAQTGTPAAGLTWALFGAGTAAVVSLCRRLDLGSRETLLGGAFVVGIIVAATGWLGAGFHHRPWGLPSQGLWRASSTLTYANATAALLVPLALAALARLASAPGPAHLSLAATGLLAGAGATLSRAGAAAFVAGFVVLCAAGGVRTVLRAALGPLAGAGVVLAGLIPSLRATGPARPLVALAALAAGLLTAVLLPRLRGRTLGLLATGAVLAAAFIGIYRAPGVPGAIHVVVGSRFSLASANRTGETATAMRMIAQHPLAGAGPGHATLRWIGADGGLRVDRYDHDEYLQVLSDLGIIGAVLFAIFLAAVGHLLWRARPILRPVLRSIPPSRPGRPRHADLPDRPDQRRNTVLPSGADPRHRAVWAGAVAATAAFCLHSGFDFLWHIPVIPLTVAALIGLAAPPLTRPTATAAAETRKDNR